MSDFSQLDGRLLVVYDGHCGLCNKSIRWCLRRDTLDRLRFIPSESPQVAALLARHRFTSSDSPASPDSNFDSIPDTLFVIRDAGGPTERVFLRSDATITLLAALPAPWPAIAAIFRCVPRPLRDLVYRLIARSRYRIWGRYDTCPLPTPAERAHFL